ncbi:MAG: hypothetical protein OXH38_12225 [Chloroflexi bacterium]|nr:hypothetical protein [Chloroflexota bacterium]
MSRQGALLALLALLAVGVVAAVPLPQSGRWMIDSAHAQAAPPLEVRIAAQRLENGNTEFALQVIDRATGQAGPRLLPSPRFLSRTTIPGSWRNSGPLELSDGVTLRISARILTDGRIEFGMQQRLSDNQWSDRILPHQRLLPAYPVVRTWLVGSDVAFPQPTHVPIANARGRFSYTGRYESALFRDVVGSSLRNASQTGDVQLSLLCQYGLGLSLTSLPEIEAESVDVTLALSNGMTATSSWRVYQKTILQSPDTWADFNRLQQAKSLSVHIPDLLSVPQQFDLTDMFTTPIQGNLEHCGNYAPGAIRELPPPVRRYMWGQTTSFNGASSEVRWSQERQAGTLSRVVLEERHLLRPGDHAPVNYPFSLVLHLLCDRQGLTIALDGSLVDSAFDRDNGDSLRLRWSLDGEPLVNFPWQQVRGALHLRDAGAFLETVRPGSRLEVSLNNEERDTFAFDLPTILGSPAQVAFEECVQSPMLADPLPYTEFDGWRGTKVPGVSYRVGSDRVGGLDWWTEVVLDEQSLRIDEPLAFQQLHMTCGLDGVGVKLTNVGAGQPVFLRGWPATIEVAWDTDADSGTGSWDVWNLEFYNHGFTVSPADDHAFFQRVQGAETLTVWVQTEPYPVTLSFDFAQPGVWDTPAAINLNACDH